MSEDEAAGPSPRQELIITVVFLVVGLVFLVVAVYSATGQWADVMTAIDAAQETPTSRVFMQELNQQILAAFIGAVLFASGVLRWRE